MKLFLHYILLIPLFFSNLAFGKSAINLSHQELEIYNETLQYCRSGFINGSTLDSFLISSGQTFTALYSTEENKTREALQKWLVEGGVGIYLADRLKSSGFTLALEQCYPNSPEKRNRYVISLLLADASGKFIPSAGISIVPLRVGLKMWSILLSTFPKYSKFFRLFATLSGASISVYSGYMIYTEIKKIQTDIDQRTKALHQMLDPMAELSLAQIMENQKVILGLYEEQIRMYEVLLEDSSISSTEKNDIQRKISETKVKKLNFDKNFKKIITEQKGVHYVQNE